MLPSATAAPVGYSFSEGSTSANRAVLLLISVVDLEWEMLYVCVCKCVNLNSNCEREIGVGARNEFEIVCLKSTYLGEDLKVDTFVPYRLRSTHKD